MAQKKKNNKNLTIGILDPNGQDGRLSPEYWGSLDQQRPKLILAETLRRDFLDWGKAFSRKEEGSESDRRGPLTLPGGM